MAKHIILPMIELTTSKTANDNIAQDTSSNFQNTAKTSKQHEKGNTTVVDVSQEDTCSRGKQGIEQNYKFPYFFLILSILQVGFIKFKIIIFDIILNIN